MVDKRSQNHLPKIPNQHYFTIGEVSELCDIKRHVLRYWEREFPTLSPVRRRGNRRYYTRQEVIMIRKIRKMLYEDRFTIEGVRLQLQSSGKKSTRKDSDRQTLENTVKRLKGVLKTLA